MSCRRILQGVAVLAHVLLAAATVSASNLEPARRFPPPVLEAARTFPAGAAPGALAAADFDRDGDTDLAIADRPSDAVIVLLASGGDFAAPVAYAVGDEPIDLAAIDLDGDGDTDLAAVNYAGASITILANSGRGTFLATAVLPTPELYPVAIFAGELDGRPGADLVVAQAGADLGGRALALFPNRGDGAFDPPLAIETGGSYPMSLTGADLDGDRDLDLAAGLAFDNAVGVLENKGDGRFGPPTIIPIASQALALRAADLDRDGDQDLLAAAWNLVVLRNQGGGAFDPPLALETARGAGQLTIADADGDGDPDVAVTQGPDCCDASWVEVFVNRGGGVLASAGFWPTGQGPGGIAFLTRVGGAPDVVVSAARLGRVVVHGGRGGGRLIAQHEVITDHNPIAVVAADLDGDRDLDLAFAHDYLATISVLENPGDGQFLGYGHTFPSGSGGGLAGLAAADLDGDGAVDLVAARESAGISVHRGRGDGTFGAAAHVATGPAPRALVAADLDGDQDADLVVANSGDDTISLLRNRGAGSFDPALQLAAGRGPDGLAAADLDGDRDLDLAVANRGASTVSVFLNRGGGEFGPRADHKAGDEPRDVAALDLDRDGRLDLAVANGSGRSVSVLLGRGGGAFGPRHDVPLAGPVVALAPIDLDGDGFEELAAVEANDSVTLLRGFPPERLGSFLTGMAPEAIAAADLDGDRLLDLAVANRYGFASWDGTVAVLRNAGETPAAAGRPAPAARVATATSVRVQISPGGVIIYDLARESAVKVAVYDLAGRQVVELESPARHPAGAHRLVWDGQDARGRRVARGVYFVRVEAAGSLAHARILVD